MGERMEANAKEQIILERKLAMQVQKSKELEQELAWELEAHECERLALFKRMDVCGRKWIRRLPHLLQSSRKLARFSKPRIRRPSIRNLTNSSSFHVAQIVDLSYCLVQELAG